LPRSGRPVAMRKDLGLVLVSATAGALLLALAVPRFMAAVISAPYDQTMRDMGDAAKAGTVSQDMLQAAASSRKRALRWQDNPRLWTDLGALQLEQAEAAGFTTAQGRELAARSLDSHRQGLALDPAQPYAWLRMAKAELVTAGMTPALNPPLQMSVRTAPREPQLVLDRLELAFTVWPMLDKTTRAMMNEQVVIAARFYEKKLALMARRHQALDIIADALHDEEGLYRRVGFYYRRGY
jgi:hypothetical protein